MRMGYDVFLSDACQKFIEDGALAKIFAIIKQDLMEELVSTPPGATADRERIYHEIHALAMVDLKMQAIVDSLRFPRYD